MELTLLFAYWMFGIGYVSSVMKEHSNEGRAARAFVFVFVLSIWPVAFGADLYKFINKPKGV